MTVNSFLQAFLRVGIGLLFASRVWAFDEGIDYSKLAEPQPTESEDKVEVLEIFMYTCPHCYHLQPTMDKWLASEPENVEHHHMPLVSRAALEPYARAYYAAEVLGKLDQFHEPLFRALHVDKKRIASEDALIAFAVEQGIDEDEFRKAYDSFHVHVRVRRAKAMVERYGIDGVPSVVVNGKYLTSPSQVGGRDRMIEVIEHLIEIESGTLAAEREGTAAVAAPVAHPATSSAYPGDG